MAPRRLTFAVSATLLTASLSSGCSKPIVNTVPESPPDGPHVNPAGPSDEPDVDAPDADAPEGEDEERPPKPDPGPIVNTRPDAP